MVNFGHQHYVPVLRSKEGEYRAVADLEAASYPNLTPLAEAIPQRWNWDTNEPQKGLEDHLSDIADKLAESWRNVGPFFLDTVRIDPGLRTAAGGHPLTFLIDRLDASGVQVIPVTGPDRDRAHVAACATVNARDHRGVCIRIPRDEMAEANISKKISNLLQQLDVPSTEAHAIIDMETIDQNSINLSAMSVEMFINNCPFPNESRTLTILSGAFPENMSAFAHGVNHHPRSDWRLWKELMHRQPRRLPAYGDYQIDHPYLTDEVDPRLMRMSASIRYTVADEWLVPKGYWVHDPRRGGFQQYHDLAAQLVTRPEFAGPGFSAGDTFIDEVAKRARGPGNPKDWRQHPCNHHLERVLTDLANSRGS